MTKANDEPALLMLLLMGFRAAVRVTDGVVHATHHSPPGWYHIVINYLGPNDGKGIRLYPDGSEVAGQASIDRTSYDVGDSRVVVG